MDSIDDARKGRADINEMSHYLYDDAIENTNFIVFWPKIIIKYILVIWNNSK